MRGLVKYVIVALSVMVSVAQSASGYMFGFKSWDNTPENILWVEKTQQIELPVVGFIFDPWDDRAEATFIRAANLLGKNRIYHVTVSPGLMTAKSVAE